MNQERSLWRRDILSLADMSPQDIDLVLRTAQEMKGIINRDSKKVTALRGKAIVNLFYEPSTRTRTSFELAGKYLGADVVNVTAGTSSVVKGESLRDTLLTIEAMGVDAIVIRHSADGAAQHAAQVVSPVVINAGDGAHEHPTQALLDLFTMREAGKDFSRLKVAIIGDILYSRVARSDIWGLTKFGAQVHVAGPATLMPRDMAKLGVRVHRRVEEAIEGADVVIVLRLQLERQCKGLFPSAREYARLFGVNASRLAGAKSDVLLMHPGPMNRGVEIAPDVAYDERSYVQRQVTNGVAVRMALLYLVLAGRD